MATPTPSWLSLDSSEVLSFGSGPGFDPSSGISGSYEIEAKMVVNSVHWFRKGLRLHDNPALQEALNGADTLRCVYILDPWFAGAANVGINRWRLVR